MAGFSLLGTSPAEGATTCSRYASPSGSDTAAGTLTAPYKTAQKLATSLQAGETGCLRQGTYTKTGTYVFSMAHGGTASAPITITSYPGEKATIQGIVQIPNGDNYVTLSGMNFEGTGTMNSIEIYATGIHIEDNDITNNWHGLSCMMLGSNSAGQALQPVISGNVFHDCGLPANGNKDHGIYAANVNEGQIVNNLFYDSAAYAIQLYPNAQKTTFAHNVIDGRSPSVRGGLVFGGDENYASAGNVVEMNVIAFAATYDVSSVWAGAVGAGNVARNNCLYGGGQGELSNGGGLTSDGNLTANPQFQNAAEDNFRLAAGSPCLEKVGYDTVALIEAGGVEVPTEAPVATPPVVESPVTPPAEETSPVPPPVVPPVVVKPPTPPAHHPSEEASHGSTGISESRPTANPESPGNVSIRAHLVSSSTHVAIKGKVNTRKVAGYAVKIKLASASGWRRTVTDTVTAKGAFNLNLRVPRKASGLVVQAYVAGVGKSPAVHA
jgi:Right handed beta helix region